MVLFGGEKQQIKQKHMCEARQKGIALLLVVVILCLLLPISASATGETSERNGGNIEGNLSTDVIVNNFDSSYSSGKACTISNETNTVSVTGCLPDGARLKVVPLGDDQLGEYSVAADTVDSVIFAYDIKIMIPSSEGEIEYQPGEEQPVTVTITPQEPIKAHGVDVVHIAENESGNIVAQPVEDVITTENRVEFEAKGFSVYIGTMGSGAGITLTPGSGYAFYFDAACGTVIPSGSYFSALPKTIYLKANDYYTIESVAIKNEDDTDSAATALESSGIWTLTFPYSLTENQIITVTTYVHANGGTIVAGSTIEQVATIFDATATSAETDNVLVSGGGGSFTVQVKNNILLKGSINMALGANVTLTTSGDLTIKRDPASCSGVMFAVNGTLSLGTGTGSGGTVTYHFSDDSSETYAPNDAIPTPSGNVNIARVTVERGYTSTTEGTLTVDGGAVFSTPVNAETKTVPVCTTSSTGSIVESSGTLELWNGVTLQNNFTNIDASNDGDTDAGVRIIDGYFYMYGGKITQCSTWRGVSFSDGGGVCFTNGDAFFYGGEITQCCSDNGAAVAIFGAGSNTPTAYYLGTDIHLNLASNAPDFPGQACSAYNGGAIRMYAGSITNNKNTYTDENADFDMKPSGTNSGIDLFGGTIGKLGVVAGATVNVYSCEITTIYGSGSVVYKKGYVVTVPDCVALTTTDAVKISVKKEISGTYEDYITITKTGDGTNRYLNVDLLAGTYQLTVDSPSMRKEYTAVVSNVAVTATPKSRTMTVPKVISRTSNSIDLITAGTGNTEADGEIFYGYSSTNDATGIAWQPFPSFLTSSGLNGGERYYFFIKAAVPMSNPNDFVESISSGLVVDFPITPAVTINVSDQNPVLMDSGKSTTLQIITSPENYDVSRIDWTISGQNHVGTGIVRKSNGYGLVTIDTAESASTFTVTVELLDKDGKKIGGGVIDTVTIQVNPSAYIGYASAEAPTTLTAQLSLNLGGIYAYHWERADSGSSVYSVISGETTNTYTATYNDIGKSIRVVINNGDMEYTSEPVIILAPQLYVTVPLTTVVTVDAGGTCTVAGGLITNNSAVDVYVTGVDYSWRTSGGSDADELFYNYELVTATLTLNGTQYNFGGADPTAASPTAASGRVAAKNGDTAGTLALSWDFSLGMGNYLKLAPTVESPSQVATITYTVDYLPVP